MLLRWVDVDLVIRFGVAMTKIVAATWTRSRPQLLLLCGQANEVCAAAQPNECEGGSVAMRNIRIAPPPQFPPPRKVAVAISADTFVPDYVSDAAPLCQRMGVYPGSPVYCPPPATVVRT